MYSILVYTETLCFQERNQIWIQYNIFGDILNLRAQYKYVYRVFFFYSLGIFNFLYYGSNEIILLSKSTYYFKKFQNRFLYFKKYI